MRKLICVFVISCSLVFARAQTDTGSAAPPPGSISTSNTVGTSTLSTNAAGGNVTIDQLSAQLQSLRTAVEETLPTLSGFNQQSSSQGGQSLSGRLNDLLGRNQQPSSSPTSERLTNVIGALGALIHTNNQTGNPEVNQNTAQDLATLQRDLEPVQQILQRLVSSGSQTNQFPPPDTGRVPSPTGR